MKPSLLVFVFAGTIALAQQHSPQSSQRAEKRPKVTANHFLRFRYRVGFSEQGSYLAGFSKLHASTDNSATSEESPQRVHPGINKNVKITLERGTVVQDPSFSEWVNRIRATSVTRDLVIDSFNEAGQKSSSMHLDRCAVTEYQSTPELEGPRNSATVRVMTLHCAQMRRSTH